MIQIKVMIRTIGFACLLCTLCHTAYGDVNSSDSVAAEVETMWVVDFFDDFDSFNDENWQDQILWVNKELQCYVSDGAHGTREVSNGSLKLRVLQLDEPVVCDNIDKHGEQLPDTNIVAGRIASKNRKEFVGGRWTARLRTNHNGTASQFPAWWILGARNNEPPVQQEDENVCWPLEGSGEIDIFEHYGAGGADHYTARMIKSLGECDKGDWKTYMKVIDTTLNQYHEYAVEWSGDDLIYRLDGTEVYRNEGAASDFPEPMFAILNYAKIPTDEEVDDLKMPWVMEVDWVRHETLKP